MSTEYVPSPEAQAALDAALSGIESAPDTGVGAPIRVIYPEDQKLERVTDEPTTEATTETTETVAEPTRAVPYDYKTALAEAVKTVAGEQAEEIAALAPKEQAERLTALYTGLQAELQTKIQELELAAEQATITIDSDPDSWDPNEQITKLLIHPDDPNAEEPFYDKLVAQNLEDHAVEYLPKMFERFSGGQMNPEEQQSFWNALQYGTSETLTALQNNTLGIPQGQELNVGQVLELIKAFKSGQLVPAQYSPRTPGPQVFLPGSTTPAFGGNGDYTPPSYISAKKLVDEEGFAEDHPRVTELLQAAYREQSERDQLLNQVRAANKVQQEWKAWQQKQEEASKGIRQLSETSQTKAMEADLDAELEDYLADRITLPNDKEYEDWPETIWSEIDNAVKTNSVTAGIRGQITSMYKHGMQHTAAMKQAMFRYRAAIDDVASPIAEKHMQRVKLIEDGKRAASNSKGKGTQKVTPKPPPAEQKLVDVRQRPGARPRIDINAIYNEGLDTMAEMEAAGIIPKLDLPTR